MAFGLKMKTNVRIIYKQFYRRPPENRHLTSILIKFYSVGFLPSQE
jgi:hypothetical protein